jgi:plastocyanin
MDENNNRTSSSSNTNNKNLVLVIAMVAIGIAILIIAFAGINKNNQDSNPSDNAVELNTEQPPVSEVFIGQNSFEPQQITVPVGSQVKFTNKTENPIELVQSPADTTQLQEFNLDEKLTNESSYAYNFEEVGVFNIQDKNDPVKWNIVIDVKQPE